ncbi:hypothetical protein [Crenalkalicoccus roseus]|uniref:hypothetical protein n=1 Tax=Crenalkalicoccus roseus TaxID=1485588 RepID=UPI0010814A67|nr:hypothetical protein [Crenalkalicoccus roseus]
MRFPSSTAANPSGALLRPATKTLPALPARPASPRSDAPRAARMAPAAVADAGRLRFGAGMRRG